MKHQVLLGVCPIGKFVFSHEDAIVQKKKIFALLDSTNITHCHLDAVLADTDGLVRRQDQVARVVQYFRDKHIDALFIPHCNFGTEGAAGLIARELGVPVLLWGPQDGPPEADGIRLRDSLCGMFATSKVLHTLKVPFTYINNCHPHEATFTEGLDLFLRAVRVVKSMRNMRIGILGERINFFWSLISSESSLLQKFNIQLHPLNLADMLRELPGDVQRSRSRYEEELSQLRSWMSFNGYPNDEPILANLALRDRLLEAAAAHNLNGFSIQTFPAIPSAIGAFPCLAAALLNEAGIPVGPEGDVHAVISSIILEAASKHDEPSCSPEFTIRHPTNPNAVLMWHAEAPPSLRQPGTPVACDLPWILKGLPPGLINFRLKDGPVTLCRFDGDGDSYRLGVGQGKTVDGPYTREFYAWVEVNDWPRWERQLIYGPYPHHCSMTYGHCVDVLKEAMRYLPQLTLETFGG